jgi:hypothetical protein
MNLKSILLLASCLSIINVFSQKEKAISLEFGYDLHIYEMNGLNNDLSNGFLTNQLNESENTIQNGQNFQFNLAYQPIALFDIGAYGGYQYANQKSAPSFYQMNEYNLPIKECSGRYELRTEAITVGLATTWYVSHVLKFQEKENMLNRLHFGVELNVGIGFSKISSNLQPPSGVIEKKEYLSYSSQDFQGKIGLKVEYDITKSLFFTTIGFKGGYQYFTTKAVKDRLDNEWNVNNKHPISLDFSGVYFGIYLKVGK